MRRILAATLAFALALALPAAAGAGEPFSFDRLAERARALAAAPYAPAPVRYAELLERIDYDAHWRIRFRPEATVMAGSVPVQFFHLGALFRQPVAMHVVENGIARPVPYGRDLFEMPADSPARALPADAGFAGFRIMRPGLAPDWISFLGAAYFRADGPMAQYGLSARGLALGTGLPEPEEFPRFTGFWIEPGPGGGAGEVIVHALMDSPTVAGAYRMDIRHTEGLGQMMEIEARLFFRAAPARLGIAPLTSMFWYSESNRFAATDWRPEVHDTDGLMLLTGAGEAIWRPLNNPPRVVTSSFADVNPRGFGLMKRDRRFENYQDDGVFYERRPSVWIEPLGDWGAGAVQLVEIPTDDEIFDNIVAFWNPAAVPGPGEALALRYRLHWTHDAPVEPLPVARTVSTHIGHGGRPGHRPRPADTLKVVIDFAGGRIAAFGKGMGVEPVITAPPGVEIVNPYALPVRGTDRWRLVFDLRAAPGIETADLRAYLAADGVALTETWLGQIHPGQILALLD
jgi:glucans biosynthesis protein